MKPIKQPPQPKLKFNYANATLFTLTIASICLIIWGINIYRMTIVPLKYLFTVVVFGTFISFPLIRYRLKPSYKKVWLFLTSIAIGGGTFYFSFLYLNSKYSEKENYTEILKIIRTGNLAKGRGGGCRSPYAVVNFNGTEKELIFLCDYEKTINTFSKIQIQYSTGFFGFEIIKTKSLLK